MDMTQTLWEAVPRHFVEWLRSLDFGFFEWDCLLIHGSTVTVSEELTPETSPILLLDRLLRMDANLLFCGRSGLSFQYEIQQATVNSVVMTLDQTPSPQTTLIKPRQVIGVGNVGRLPGQASYTLYSPDSQQLLFKTVRYGNGKGFSPFKS